MESDLPLFDVERRGEAPPSETKIHETAIVEEGAKLGQGVEVGPYSVIGPNVSLGDGVKVGSHVVIENRTTIGPRTVIHSFATIGVYPQDLKYQGEDAELVIGAENSIRQYVNISIGSGADQGKTEIGRRNLFMVHSHVAHDCQIGDNCVFANGVSLAGHVRVFDWVVLGGHAAVHQFCRVGERSMTAGGAMVVQDVAPFCMVHGDRASTSGLNLVGLKRAGLGREELGHIKTMYRLLFKENLTVEDAVKRIEEEIPDSESRRTFTEFLRTSERGICR